MNRFRNLIGALVIFGLGYGAGHIDQAATAAAETIKTAQTAVSMVLDQACPSVEALAASKGWSYVGVIDEKYNGHRVFVPVDSTLPAGYEAIRQDNSVISLNATNRAIPGNTYNSIYPKTGCVALAPAPAAQPNTEPHLATCVDAPSATQPVVPAAQAQPAVSAGNVPALAAEKRWTYVRPIDDGGHLVQVNEAGTTLPDGYEAVVNGGGKILINSRGNDRIMPVGPASIYQK